MRRRCPRCGQDQLFSGDLTVEPHCEVCGLDFAFIGSGDGPAVFVILIVGFVLIGAALLTEIVHQPPLWQHGVIWLPLTLVLCLGMVRPLEGILIALQYHHKAEEDRLSGR